MSEKSAKMSEQWAVLGTIDPDAYVASTVLSDAIDMSLYDQVIAVVMAGTLGSSATLDAKMTQATTSGGTYKDVTGAAITQLTQASPDDSDKQALIVVDQNDIGILVRYGIELLASHALHAQYLSRDSRRAKLPLPHASK